MQEGSKKGYTSHYLTAVQGATNTVSTWLQKDETLDSIPSQVEAAAVQLHDEGPARKNTEVTCLIHPVTLCASLTLLPLKLLLFMSPSIYACDICPLLCCL